MVDEIVRRYRLHGRGSRRKHFTLAAVLVDLEKAFDLIDRNQIWESLERLAMERKARLTVEELHEGTCEGPEDQPPCEEAAGSEGRKAGQRRGPGTLHRGLRHDHEGRGESVRRGGLRGHQDDA